MGFSTIFIRRPVATSLLMAGLLLLGLMGYRKLPVAALPEIDAPSLVVSTQYPGASAETMATLVTTPLERRLGQIAGLELMSSDSSAGLSTIVLQFAMNRDIDLAAQDVQQALRQATLPGSLPYAPTYNRVNPADAPIMTLKLSSATVPLREINGLADSILAQRLAQVQGVGLVTIAGNVRPAVRIQVNPDQLSNMGMTLEDLRGALTRANVAAPKGTLNGATQTYTIGTNDQLTSAAEYAETVIRYNNGRPVRLRDVATVLDGVENDQVAAWADGLPAVLLEIRRQPGANIVATVEQVTKLIPTLQGVLPADVQMEVFSDRTQTIRASVHEVQLTLWLTIGLVVAVIFVFLRRFWATVIPALAIPLSLAGTFAVMAATGMSLDNLSLMALVVATGFHVTDSPFFERVRGTDGRTLADKWQSEGMEAYKGTTVAGYPNLFVLVGPATGLGHSSMIYMIESQVNYFMDMLKTKRRHGADVAEVSARAQGEWNDWIRDRLPETVWVTGCGSWYLDEHGNAPAVWPSWTWKFRAKTKKFDASSYDLRVAKPAPAVEAAGAR